MVQKAYTRQTEKKLQQLFFQEVSNMHLDIYAPIIPFEGFGEIKLYSTRNDLKDLLEMEGVTSKILFDNWIQYDIQNDIELLFHLKNNKFIRIFIFNSLKK